MNKEPKTMIEEKFWETGGDHQEVSDVLQKYSSLPTNEFIEELHEAVEVLVNRHVGLAINEVKDELFLHPEYFETDEALNDRIVLRLVGFGDFIDGREFDLLEIIDNSELVDKRINNMGYERTRWANCLEEISKRLREIDK